MPRQSAEGKVISEQYLSFVVLAICFIIYLMLSLRFIAANSATFDENTHIAAGYRYWQCGEFADNPEHPPLVKFVAAAPLRTWRIVGFGVPCGSQIISLPASYYIAHRIANSAKATDLLIKARHAVLVFPLALLVSVFFAARAWLGDVAASMAAILFTFEPFILAQGAQVLTDMALALFAFLTVTAAIAFVRSQPARRWVWSIAAGLTMGAALASKGSAVFLPLVLALVLAGSHFVTLREQRGKGAHLFYAFVIVCAIAWAVLWCAYGFRYYSLPHATSSVYDIRGMFRSAGNSGSLSAALITGAAEHHLFPEAYLAGLALVVNDSSRPTYIFGRILPTGVPYYFPFAIAVKTTVALLALALVGILAPVLWRKHRTLYVALLAPVATYLTIGITSRLNIGLRHMLTIYPFLIVFAAAAGARLWRNKRGQIVVAMLLGWQVASSLHAAPLEISYGNELAGGSSHVYRELAGADLEWGQSYPALMHYVSEHHVSDCRVGWVGIEDVGRTGCGELFQATDPFSDALPAALPAYYNGTIILSAGTVALPAYSDLLGREPDEIIANGSLLVFRPLASGSYDLRRIAATRGTYRALWMLQHGQISAALDEFARSEEATSDKTVHELLYGYALEAAHRIAEARTHFEEVVRLAANNPSERDLLQSAVDELQNIGAQQR